MKLIPKAKPVKIRIKSGGEEHSSLDSLLHNFKVSDIEPLLDGRLVRWLKQQGENELAGVVDGIDASSLQTVYGLMYLMKIFFPEYIEKKGINDLLALAESWLKSPFFRKNGEHLCIDIIWLFDDSESLEPTKYLYKHKEELEIPKTDWYMVFLLRVNETDETKNDPEVLYLVGKMLWEGYQFNDLYANGPDRHYKEDPNGLKMIEKSARLGWQEANRFIREYNRKQKETPKDRGRFAGVNRDKLKKWINVNWENYGNSTIKYSSSDYANDREKAILDFACQCRYLVYYCANLSWGAILRKAICWFFPDNKKNSSNDMLAKEKWFIIGLLRKQIGSSGFAKDAFAKAGDYPPAEYMMGRKTLLNNSNLKSMTFPSQISYVVDHLFDYE